MAKELKTLDLNALPDAVHARYHDTMLIAKNDHDNQRTIPSCISIGKLLKKKNEQYVIGKAVNINALNIVGGMINWYCFGTSPVHRIEGSSLGCRIIFSIKTRLYRDSEGVNQYGNIKEVRIYQNYNEINPTVIHSNIQYHKTPSHVTCTADLSDWVSYTTRIIGIRVCDYNHKEGVLDLEFKVLSDTIHSASTHHWFECGKRCYRPVGGSREYVKKVMREVMGCVSYLINRNHKFPCKTTLILYKLMPRQQYWGQNNPGFVGQPLSDRKKHSRIKAFRRLKGSDGLGTLEDGLKYNKIYSHAISTGGYYKAVPIYGLGKIKSEPVFFYVRPCPYKSGYNIEWK